MTPNTGIPLHNCSSNDFCLFSNQIVVIIVASLGILQYVFYWPELVVLPRIGHLLPHNDKLIQQVMQDKLM